MIKIRKENRELRLADRHAIYAQDASDCFDAFFDSVVPEAVTDGGETVLVADFSHRRVHRILPSELEFELTGLPEERSSIDGYLRRCPESMELAFDLGAYCGVTTWELSKRAETVVALEPDPENYDALLCNRDRYFSTSDRSFLVRQQAVAGRNGREKFNFEAALGSAFPRLNGRSTVWTSGEVETVTLTTLAAFYGVPQFVKMDIEGAEVEVLLEARKVLRNNPISFAIDTNHWNGASVGTWQQCEAIFKEVGYLTESAQLGGVWQTWGWHPSLKFRETV